jgi:hypothetical protein
MRPDGSPALTQGPLPLCSLGRVRDLTAAEVLQRAVPRRRMR